MFSLRFLLDRSEISLFTASCLRTELIRLIMYANYLMIIHPKEWTACSFSLINA